MKAPRLYAFTIFVYGHWLYEQPADAPGYVTGGF